MHKLDKIQRVKISITGTVQGVGFRPFVYNLATKLHITGWVNNNTKGVTIEAEGKPSQIQKFLDLLSSEKPPLSDIENIEYSFLSPMGDRQFTIHTSDSSSHEEACAMVLPDTATCDLCLSEIFNPANKRYLYPFTTCTHCGPRYSISKNLPFDREHTSMKIFPMCSSCQFEYEDPSDRRFHAQTNSCPECGPELSLLNKAGNHILKGVAAINKICEEIKNGSIVAIKGIGGFHLFVDATNELAVEKLRERKNRKYKPFAVMMANIQQIENICAVSPAERSSLLSPSSPIVLLQKKSDLSETQIGFSEKVAPGINLCGVMLPYTPLHHILMKQLKRPLVATSANISDEPICNDEATDFNKLNHLADFILTHNRPILNSLDDAVVRIIDNEAVVFRAGRGNSPASFDYISHVEDDTKSYEIALALGGHNKNTISLLKGNKIFLSQHNGSLDKYEAQNSFQVQCQKLPNYYQSKPMVVVHDNHPHYASSLYAAQFADEKSVAVLSLQHHQAHVLSCVAEHKLSFPLLGICWDGTGYGLDESLWGGEFLLMNSASHFERLASIRPFKLPGGEKSILEPRRTALGILHGIAFENKTKQPVKEVLNKSKNFDDPNCRCEDSLNIYATDLVSDWIKTNFSDMEFENLNKMLNGNINSPTCSSAGRLFDAVASLLNVCHRNNYDGEAAMKLESLAYQWVHKNSELVSPIYSENENHCLKNILMKAPESSNTLKKNSKTAPSYWVDYKKIIFLLIQDTEQGRENSYIAFRFHLLLAHAILKVAKISAMKTIVLTGGVFQNMLLTEMTLLLLRNAALNPVTHRKVPPNDGGLSVGQAYFSAQSK